MTGGPRGQIQADCQVTVIDPPPDVLPPSWIVDVPGGSVHQDENRSAGWYDAGDEGLRDVEVDHHRLTGDRG